jgi:protein gp37
MREDAAREAVGHTFNPWWGCTRVSEGCEHCYAEAIDLRAGGGHWGPGAPRRTFGARHWAQPRAWDAEAARAGRRERVLCASMADVFDAEAPAGALAQLWALVRETPHLDWLLLTRRPGRIARALPEDWGEGWLHVWLGATVETQALAAQRLPVLLSVPARRRWACCEPLLGPLALEPWLPRLDWVVAGGESGPSARPLHPDWVRGLRDGCARAGVPLFFKQWGEFLPEAGPAPGGSGGTGERGGTGPPRGRVFTFPDGTRVRRVGRWRAGAEVDGAPLQQEPTPG